MPQDSPLTALPPELSNDIIQLLPLDSQKTACFLSQAIRKLALKSIFENVQCDAYDVSTKLGRLNEIGIDAKEVVKTLLIRSRSTSEPESEAGRVTIFDLLSSLPNLQNLTFYQYFGQAIQPAELAKFFDCIRHAPLQELHVILAGYKPIAGPVPAGISGLKSLTVDWQYDDKNGESGSRLIYLYSILEPSLPTLVELKIVNDPNGVQPDLDLQRLKAASDTLRSFEYELQSLDETILETIPVLFPHLTSLKLKWKHTSEDRRHSLLWKESYIDILAKNVNLVELQLSCDFEVNADDIVRADEDIAWFVRCYERRLKATQQLAPALPNLQKCDWLHLRIGRSVISQMVHPFVIEERESQVPEVKTRVVRGVKQWWMGRNHEDWVGDEGVIVKCKLEDLPGDVIGENDPDEEE